VAKFKFNEKKWNKQLADLSRPFMVANLAAGAKEGAAAGDLAAGAFTEWMDSPDAVAYIQSHDMKFAKSVNLNVHDRLKRSFATGVKKGETVPALKKRITKLFRTWKKSRAEMVARTESARCYTAGYRKMVAKSKVVMGLQWDAAGDACPFCLDVDGKTVKPSENFYELGDELEVDGSKLVFDYDIVEGPPLHPDCRCGLVTVFT